MQVVHFQVYKKKILVDTALTSLLCDGPHTDVMVLPTPPISSGIYQSSPEATTSEDHRELLSLFIGTVVPN